MTVRLVKWNFNEIASFNEFVQFYKPAIRGCKPSGLTNSTYYIYPDGDNDAHIWNQYYLLLREYAGWRMFRGEIAENSHRIFGATLVRINPVVT